MGYTGIPPDGKFVEDDVMIDWTKLALRYPIFRETHILTHIFGEYGESRKDISTLLRGRS
jgi:hypothetical protein